MINILKNLVKDTQNSRGFFKLQLFPEWLENIHEGEMKGKNQNKLLLILSVSS